MFIKIADECIQPLETVFLKRDKEHLEEAVLALAKAADEGDGDACYFAGICYEIGEGVEKGLVRAEELLMKGALAGNPRCILDAFFKMHGTEEQIKAIPKTVAEAAKELAELALGNDDAAKSQVGIAVLQNRTNFWRMPRESAEHMLLEAARNGYIPAATFFITYMSNTRNIVEMTEREWLMDIVRDLCKKDIVDAFRFLGKFYYDTANFKKSAEYYRTAMEHSDPVAAARLAVYYRQGIGVEADDDKARECEKKASEVFLYRAERGDLFSANIIAGYYAEGRGGFEQDFEQAFYWYDFAGEHGDVNGAVMSAYCKLTGRGTEQQAEEGLEKLKEIWKKTHHNTACGYIAYAYENGIGVKQDLNVAMSYYEHIKDTELVREHLKQFKKNAFGKWKKVNE